MPQEPTHPIGPDARAAGRSATAGQWRREFRILLMLGRVGGVRWWHYALPVTLMLAAATLEGASMALLVPLATGLAADSFSALWQIPGFSTLRVWFPDAYAFISESNRRTFLFIVGLLFAASVVSVLLGLAASRLSTWRNGLYTARVKSHTLARCLSFGKLYFDRTPQASIYDVINYSDVLLKVLTALEVAADSFFRLMAHGLVMLSISWQMTLFMAIAFPVLQLIDRRIVRRGGQAAEGAVEIGQDFLRQVFNVISSIPLMKTFALEARTRSRHDALVERLRVFTLQRDNAALLASPLQQIVALSALFLAVVVAVAFTTSDRTAELGVICAFLLVVRRVVPILGFATDLRIKLGQARPMLERIADVYDDTDKFFITSGSRELGGLRQGIEFRGLSFNYADGPPVLRGLSCTFPAGKTTAIVGETGCGKTTVASLITRLYECPPATLLLDGIDIRALTRESLARHLAYVGQDAWLFNDTIRANLLIGLDRPVTDDELRDMLTRVRLGELMTQLPGGLDTEIGDRGVKLSGGERQRLCIARALLRRADLVLLDEATSALDSQTERDVLQTIEQATRGATVITIAHRLSTVRSADNILVLAHGELIEQGSWHQLVGAEGAFAAMWTIQSQMADQRRETVAEESTAH